MANQTVRPKSFEELVAECMKEVIAETKSGEELTKRKVEEVAFTKMKSGLLSLGFTYDPHIFHTAIEKALREALQKGILVFRKK